MRGYIFRRILAMIPTLFLASVVAFIIIQLPPGDFATAYASTLAATGDVVSQMRVQMREETGSRCSNEMPKSPRVKIPFIHLKY